MPLSAICGILGDGKTPQDLAPLLTALADFGPQRRVARSGSMWLGCRCPAAGNPDAGASALAEDLRAGLVVVADARIDDRDPLCDALAVPHRKRSSLTDAELVLRAFQRWREASPVHLIGDYAFAAWDRRSATLFCACDHLGARPFYYAYAGDRFVFANTVQAVLAAPGVSTELDAGVVAAKLSSVRPDTVARTSYQAVRKLPAGHALVVQRVASPSASRARVRLRMARHWRPEEIRATSPPASDDTYAEQFLDLYCKAVGDRLGGGPVGVHLSGGLDSSSVAVLAARELRRLGRPPPPAFSWLPAKRKAAQTPKPGHSWEYALTDAVAVQEGLEVSFCAPRPSRILDALRFDGTLPGADLPFAESRVLACAAAAGVRTLLSGAGGDECVSFNGRGHWQHLLLAGHWSQLRAEVSAHDGGWRLLAVYGLGLLHPALHPALARWRNGRGVRRTNFLNPKFAPRRLPVRAPVRMIGVRRTQLAFLRDGRLGFQAEWHARAAEHGIEYAFPLLDRRLLEFALSLPPQQFRRPGHDRWLMRHALRQVLPPEVCYNRRKDDPARFEPLMDAIVETLPAVRHRILARTPSRASYVDMPSLLERLDPSRFRAAPQFEPIRAALQFLDW